MSSQFQGFNSNNNKGFNSNNSGFQGFGDSTSKKKEGSSFIGNAVDDAKAIGAGVSTLAGAIFGFDKEARAAIGQAFKDFGNSDSKIEDLANMMLDTYNVTVDEIFNQPLGDTLYQIATGIYEHPVSAALDIIPLTKAAKPLSATKFLNKFEKVNDFSKRIQFADEVLQDNVRAANYSEDFLKKINKIEKTYKPEEISAGIKQIENIGIKNTPEALKPVVKDLREANYIYKKIYQSAGVQLENPIEMATKELIARNLNVPYSKIDDTIMDRNLYLDFKKNVIQNRIEPIFHLAPKLLEQSSELAKDVTSDILKRKFGTMDYIEAGKNITKKAEDFVTKIQRFTAGNTINRINQKIHIFNNKYNRKITPLSGTSSLASKVSKTLGDLNSELKKVMLSGGTYLGANMITTTLTILNNFDGKALARTLKNIPKFRLIDVPEATTPILNIISKVNNKFYRPVASVDKWIESIGARYIQEVGLDKAKLMQSMVPSYAPTYSRFQEIIKSTIPFGSYPSAAMGEIAQNVINRPGKTLVYNQIQKGGQQINENIQSQIPDLKEIDKTKVIRQDKNGKLVQKQTIITPIQAANMFLLGEQGDALQVAVYQFINNLISGKGDPNILTVDGKHYRIENGMIKTSKGSFYILPAITFAARKVLSPVQVYNQVITPMLSDKTIRDDKKLTDTLVNESQYSNMNSFAQRKVTERTREKLLKRLTGTYEYNYYEPYVSKNTRMKLQRQLSVRKNIETALENKE